MFCGMKIPVWRTPLALSQVDQRIPRVPRLDGLMFNLSQVLILALSKCCIISPFTSWSKRKLFAQKSTNCWKLRICYTFWFSLEMGRLKVWGQAGQKVEFAHSEQFTMLCFSVSSCHINSPQVLLHSEGVWYLEENMLLQKIK